MKLETEAVSLLKKASLPSSFVTDIFQTEFNNIIKNFEEVDKADAGILGVPFDTTSVWSGRRGSSMAPAEVRRMFQYLGSYEPQLDIDLSKDFTIVDFGDVDVIHTDVLKSYQRIETVATAIFKTGVPLAIIGGDHGITYATVKALCKTTKGKVGLINVDAHPDVRESHHGEISSGTQFRRLLTEIDNPINPRNFVEIGIRGWENNPASKKFLDEKGIRYITANEVRERGIKPVIKEALEIISDHTEATYLSLDVDGLDICYAPGTPAPTPGGLSPSDYLDIVYAFATSDGSRAMDVVEISPPFDTNNITSIIGAYLIAQFMGGIKKKKIRM